MLMDLHLLFKLKQPMKSNKISIAIIDDHTLFANGLKSILEQFEDFYLYDISSTSKDFLALFKTYPIDIAIIDLNLPEINGEEIFNIINGKYPNTKTIIITMQCSKVDSDRLLLNGAKAILPKDFDAQILKQLIKDAHLDNLIPKSHFKSHQLLERLYKNAYGLTRRELDICRLINENKTTRQISELISLSEFTVETHRKNIKRKLGATSLTEMLKMISAIKSS
jgi:DNA-binding NarL/FixJ family response regulator